LSISSDRAANRINPAWERTLGYTREELMSRPFIEFVHPDDRERTLKQNAQVRGGGQALAFENRYLCKDGSFRWFRWNAAPDSFEDDENYWDTVENYISRHTSTMFSHGICPSCMATVGEAQLESMESE
jgi:PAS domain S-box-containing protein